MTIHHVTYHQCSDYESHRGGHSSNHQIRCVVSLSVLIENSDPFEFLQCDIKKSIGTTCKSYRARRKSSSDRTAESRASERLPVPTSIVPYLRHTHLYCAYKIPGKLSTQNEASPSRLAASYRCGAITLGCTIAIHSWIVCLTSKRVIEDTYGYP